MPQRLPTPVVVLGVLALGVGAVVLVLSSGDGGPGSSGTSSTGTGTGTEPGGQRPPDMRGLPGAQDPTPGPVPGTVGTTNLGPGGGAPDTTRLPHGLDVEDPAQVRQALADALARPVVDWRLVARLLSHVDGALDPGVRQMLLRELRHGDRNGALLAFDRCRDPNLVGDLFFLLDDVTLEPAARQAVLQALSTVDGGDPADVVRGLEARMNGTLRHDVTLLQAISVRGGREAARVLVEYLMRSDRPERVPNYAYLRLDVVSDREAAEVVADALASAREPRLVVALARIAGRPGADLFVGPLIALDSEDQPDAVRSTVLQSLGRIGSGEAVRHLVAAAARDDALGEEALRALGSIERGGDEARRLLLEGYEDAATSPRPEAARAAYLRALGSMAHPDALPTLVRALSDPDPLVQRMAVRGVGRMRAAAEDHTEALLEVYSTADDMTRREVLIAFGNIGGRKALNLLEQIASDETLPDMLLRTARMTLEALRRRLRDEERDRSGDASLGSGPR